MLYTFFVSILGESLAEILLELGLKKIAGRFFSKKAQNEKVRFAKQLQQGNYDTIQKALVLAREDIINYCMTGAERNQFTKNLDSLLESEFEALPDEFSKQITQVYLLENPDCTTIPSIIKSLHQRLLKAQVFQENKLSEEKHTELLHRFFLAYRERLLQQPECSFLREYFQLTEIRKQTDMHQVICEKLSEISAHIAKPVYDFNVINKEYREYLIRELKDHVIRGFAPQVGGRVISLPLAKIFLPLQAIEGRPALAKFAEEDLQQQSTATELMGEFDWQRRREEMEKRHAQLSAQQVVQRPLKLSDLLKNSRSVLLGDPGTGKTTVTRYITYALAIGDTTHIGVSARNLIPVLVRIANYGRAFERESTLHLIRYIENELTPRHEFGRFLHQTIESGNCLIILDGLDEVTNPSLRLQVTDRIQEMVASFNLNHYLVTSRIVGYDVSPLTREFTHSTLRDLSTEDQERFVRLWYEAIKSEISDSTHPDGADALIDALRVKPQIARMAANPLLLTIMVLMHWRGVKLPSRRVQVYQIATDTLVEYWTMQRGIVELDAEEIKAILAPIAHYILSSNVGGVIGHHDLMPRFYCGIVEQRGCGQNEAKRIGQKLLKDLSEQSGLFLERGRDSNDLPVYGFLHQTFGEYLAALHLAQQVLNQCFTLSDYIHRSMWHESLLLLSGHLSIVSPGHANTLLRNLLDFPAPLEDILQRNLLLAADCLADDIQVRPSLRDEILDKLARLLLHEAPQIQEAAVARYKKLAATRHRDAAILSLKRVYSLENKSDISGIPAINRLNLATSLIHLRELKSAKPIIEQFDKEVIAQSDRWYIGEKRAKKIHRNEIHLLRFKGWPEQASEYFEQLKQKEDYSPWISIGSELAQCQIGPIDAELVKRLLGKRGCSSFLDSIKNIVTDKNEHAKLLWIDSLISNETSNETLLKFIESENPAEIRCLAALSLLESEHRSVAIKILIDLIKNESEQAPEAAQALLEIGELSDSDLILIQDTAMMAQDENVHQAIITLLRAEKPMIALPAILNFFATCRPSYSPRDKKIWAVVEGLIKYGQKELGLAAANWLALRPGFRHRYDACEALLESGEVERAVSLLHYLIYECHDEASQKACKRLLTLKEVERVIPILTLVSQQADPGLRYQAALALALANYPNHLDARTSKSRSQMKLGIWQDRARSYKSALRDFCETASNLLDSYKTNNSQVYSFIELGRLNLNLLSHSFVTVEQVNEFSNLINDICPALNLNTALFYMRVGQLNKAKKIIVKLLEEMDQPLSLPLKIQALKALSQIIAPETSKLLTKALEDNNYQVRQCAAEGLGPLGDASTAQSLITALTDEDRNVRKAVAEALGRIGEPSAINAITIALSDEDSNVRRSAAHALGNIGDSAALQPLIIALKDNDQDVRYSAARALGDLKASAAVEPLIYALNDKSGIVREIAAFALRELNDRSSIPHLIYALKDKERDVRRQASLALAQLGDEITIKTLIEALNDNDPNLRESAARALGWFGWYGKFDEYEIVKPIQNLLNDKQIEVRLSAIWALGQLDNKNIRPTLIHTLADPNPEIRGAAAEALGELGDASAIQPLINALSDEESNVRYSSAVALGRLDDPIAVPYLITALGDEESSVRWISARALGELGDKTAIKPLIDALSFEDSNVRDEAIRALAELCSFDEVPHILDGLSDPDNFVRSNSARALGKLRKTDATTLLANTSVAEYNYCAREYAKALIHLDPHCAIPVLDRYARQFSQESWIEQFRGHALWRLHDTDAALIQFQKAIEMEYDTSNLLALAHFYLEQNDLQQSEEFVHRALKIRKRNASCLLSHSVLLWIKGEIATSLEKLSQAQQRYRRITRVKDLEYDDFWGSVAITALEEMLVKQQKNRR